MNTKHYFYGGAEGTRTLDPNAASVVLYHLSYNPIFELMINNHIRLARPTGLEPAAF